MRHEWPELQNLRNLAADLNGEKAWRISSYAGTSPVALSTVEGLLAMIYRGEPVPDDGEIKRADSTRREILQPFVQTWIVADRDLERWRASNPRLAEIFEAALGHLRPALLPIQGNGRRGRAGRKTGAALNARRREAQRTITWIPDLCPRESDRLIPAAEAAREFFALVSNPLAAELRVCSRDHCGRYFVRTDRRKYYCAQVCANRDGSTRASRERRMEKIALAKKLRRAWRAAGKKGDWRTWVAARSRGKLTRKFLSQAWNRGDLRGHRLTGRSRESSKGSAA